MVTGISRDMNPGAIASAMPADSLTAVTAVKQSGGDPGAVLAQLTAAQQTLREQQPTDPAPLPSPPPLPSGGELDDLTKGLRGKLDALRENGPLDINALMALLIEQSDRLRGDSRAAALSDLKAKSADMDASAKEIMEAAKKRFAGAMVSGGFSIASGFVSVAGGAYGLRTVRQASTQLAAIPDESVATRASVFQNAMSKSNQVQQIGQGVNSSFQGVGGMGNSEFDRQAGIEDERKAEFDKSSMVNDALRESEKDMKQQFDQTIQELLSKISAIEQSRSETSVAIARNI